ncbi:MAG: hypothetical protein PH343_04480 [Nitrospira sp.]|nr:hypothetical protein [Nitrospira sp.]
MNNNMTENINYELTPSGKCPVCKTKIKIVENKKSMYKVIPAWICHDTFKVEIRCPVCKQNLIDKKIA